MAWQRWFGVSARTCGEAGVGAEEEVAAAGARGANGAEAAAAAAAAAAGKDEGADAAGDGDGVGGGRRDKSRKLPMIRSKTRDAASPRRLLRLMEHAKWNGGGSAVRQLAESAEFMAELEAMLRRRNLTQAQVVGDLSRMAAIAARLSTPLYADCPALVKASKDITAEVVRLAPRYVPLVEKPEWLEALVHACAVISRSPVHGGGRNGGADGRGEKLACDVVFEAVAQRLSALDPSAWQDRTVSSVLWSFARVGYAVPELFARVSAEMPERMKKMRSTQSLANTVWAFGKAGHDDDAVFGEVNAAVERLGGVHAFKVEELTALVYAHAKVNRRNAGLFREVAGALCNGKPSSRGRKAGSGGGGGGGGGSGGAGSRPLYQELWNRGLSSTAWAYAKLGVADGLLFSKLAERALYLKADFKPQELSNVAWAFAKLGFFDPKLFNKLAQRAAEVSGLMRPQELSNTLWAFVTSGLSASHPSIVRQISDEIVTRGAAHMAATELATAAWAHTKDKIDNDDAVRLVRTVRPLQK